MGALIFLTFFVPLSLWITARVAVRGDRVYLLQIISIAWIILTTLVFVANSSIPFAGGGDDESYYLLANTPLGGLTGIVDLSKFTYWMEQPGYPWLLHVLNAFTGHNLVALKLLNLFFLILLALVWYRLGILLESQRFARRMVIIILCLTPLWYYVFFLLKDLSITLLQSLLLLFSVQLWHQLRLKALYKILLTLLGLSLFRTALILQSAMVLAGSLLAKVIGVKVRGSVILSLTIVFIFLLAALFALTDPDLMRNLGIQNIARVVGSYEFIESTLTDYNKESVSPATFPLLYLLSETSGLTARSWSQLDAGWLRGFLALPWIFFLIPFFLLGMRQLIRIPREIQPATSSFARLRQWRCISTPWSAVLLFVLSSFFISLKTGDTTRWRIPDMPMMAAIAVLGWSYATVRLRTQILKLWLAGAGFLFAIYYLLKG